LATETEIAASKKPPRGVCCHEAGHAIVLHSFGLPVVVIRVLYTEEKDWHGRTCAASVDHLPVKDQVLNHAAGKAAEEFFDCPAHEKAWLKDFGKIASLLNSNGIPEDELWPRIDEAKECARTILARYRDEALKLTDRLIESGHVDAADFDHLMQSV
jgi:hypothetical protein